MSVDRLIEIASGTVGLTQDHPAFRALCGPGETEERQRVLAGLSTCALFLRGCLAQVLRELEICEPCDGHGAHLGRACGACGGVPPRVPPRLWAPYVDQRAMADLVAACEVKARDSYGVPTFEIHRYTRPGTITIIGTGNRLHVYLVERVERDGWPDGSIEVVAIEAGQLDGAGRQRVERKRHEIDAAGVDRITHEQIHASQTWVPSSVGPCPRPVAYVLDPRALLGES